MPIDLTTEKAKRNYHNRTLDIMAKLERIISNQLKPLINRQYMDAASLITHGVTDVDHVVNEQTTRLRKILRVHYRRVAFTAGRQATLNFDPAKSMNESFWNDINQYIALNTGRKITQVQDTTKKMISKVIQTGVSAGQTNREIATRIRNTGKVDSKFRALRIARTETLGLYNSATDASVRETGLKFVRVWSTTKDLRTRRRKKGSIWDHWVVDGQKRAQNDPFSVSGEKLSFPGDPKGSAGNIINCRCVLLYERDRSGQARPVSEPALTPVPSLPVINIPNQAEQNLLDIGLTNVDLKRMDQSHASAVSDQYVKLAGKYNADDIVVISARKLNKVNGKVFRIGRDRMAFMDLGDISTDKVVKSRIRAVEVGYHPEIKESLSEVGTVTHEFAHGIFSPGHFDHVKKKLGVSNTIYTQQEKVFYKKLKAIKAAQKKEINDLNFKWLQDELTFAEYQSQEKAILISQYSQENLSEFMAEAFTEFELSAKPSKYAVQVGKLVTQFFGKK